MKPKTSSGASAALFVISLGGVVFYSGVRPIIFASVLGWVMLGLTGVSTVLLAWSLRDEDFGWRASFAIVAVLAVTLIFVIFVPLWLVYIYLPTLPGPVLFTF